MKLRDYQEEITKKGVEILKKYKILYLAMEVRTGKTITALNVCKEFGANKILFVTKKKAIKSIEGDCNHFNCLDVDVINYESVGKFNNNYDIVICDEAHSLATYPKKSKRVNDLLPITTNKPIIYLSGTPAPETHTQFYHQFYVSSFSPFCRYKNFYKWAKDFVMVGKKHVYNREINDYTNANKELIQQHIGHLFITYTQKQSGFDVAISEKVLYVPLNDHQRKLINILKSNNIYECRDGDVILADTAVKLQSKIHQICSGTVKTEKGQRHVLSNDKAKYIQTYFKGKKIAVYYKFIAEFEVLKSVFENWTSDPEQFQGSERGVFLGQFVSSREGIRLDTADAIVFYNIDFSFLSYEQAKNRIISKERVKEAVLYWVFSIGGIEEKIYKHVKNKQNYTSYIFKKDYGVKL